MYPTQHHNRQWLLKVEHSSPQWWTHTPLAQSLHQFVAHGCSQIWSRPHECTSRLTSGLPEKTSYVCDKWIQGFPISWVWWCFRINCKLLCLVYYFSVEPYIPFIFLIGYFPDILKITKIQTIFKKNCSLLCSVLSAMLTIFETFNFP